MYKNEYNQAMEEHVLKVPKKVYVDVSLLKDYTLGALLYLMYSDESLSIKYNYLLDGLPQWDIRLVDDIDKYYPDIGYTQKEIDKALTDPVINNTIFKVAPATSVVDIVSHRMTDINQKTGMMKDYKTPIVTFNTYPIELSEDNQEELVNYWNDVFMVDTRVICKKITEIDSHFLLDHDEFYMQDFVNFITHEQYKDKFANGKLGDKNIYAPKRVEDYQKTMNNHKDREDIELDFVFTEFHTKLACNFSFLEDHKVSIEKG